MFSSTESRVIAADRALDRTTFRAWKFAAGYSFEALGGHREWFADRYFVEMVTPDAASAGNACPP